MSQELVNDFIDDLIRTWLKTFKTNKNIYSAFKIYTLYPFNEYLTNQIIKRIYNIIYNELKTVNRYIFNLFGNLTEMLLVPENASHFFRNWSIKLDNGYVCLYRENILQKLEKIKLHWDDCINLAKKCYDQTGFIDDNCMYIFINNNEHDFYSFYVKHDFTNFILSIYNDEIEELTDIGVYNNNLIKTKLLDLMSLGKLDIEITKYDSSKNIYWTVKLNL